MFVRVLVVLKLRCYKGAVQVLFIVLLMEWWNVMVECSGDALIKIKIAG